MKLLLTGTPRSGTRWIALALRLAGVRVGHERLLRDGMVSSIAAVDDFYYVNQRVPRTSSLDFEHVWFQTRDPCAAIPSIAKALRIDFWRWQEKHTGVPGDLEPALLRAMLYWSAWIPLVQQRNPELTYKLECLEQIWPDLLARLGVPPIDMPVREIGLFSSGAERVTFADLESIDRRAGEEVRKLASELGYG